MQDILRTAKEVSDACTSAAASATHYAHLQQTPSDVTTSQTPELLSSVTSKYLAVRAIPEGDFTLLNAARQPLCTWLEVCRLSEVLSADVRVCATSGPVA